MVIPRIDCYIKVSLADMGLKTIWAFRPFDPSKSQAQNIAMLPCVCVVGRVGRRGRWMQGHGPPFSPDDLGQQLSWYAGS